MQEVGVDVAEADANLLSRDSTAIADRPGPEAGEDPVQRPSRAESSFTPFLARGFWSEPGGTKSEHESLSLSVSASARLLNANVQ